MPPTEESPTTSQQASIRRYLTQTVRNRLNAVMDIESDEEIMDTVENRKRPRDDSEEESDEDVTAPAGSSSMITNTSLLPTSPLTDQMVLVRAETAQVANIIMHATEQDSIVPTPNDHTRGANLIRLEHQLNGVRQLSNRAVNMAEAEAADSPRTEGTPAPDGRQVDTPTGNLEWDHNDILRSPVSAQNTTIKEAIIGEIRSRLSMACDKIEEVLTTNINKIAEDVEKHSEAIKDQEIINKNFNEGIKENERASEFNFHKIEELESRLEDAATRYADTMQTTYENHANLDRVDRAMATQNELIASLSRRIETLEQKNSEQLQEREEIEKMRLRFQKSDDEKILRTVNLTGFDEAVVRNRGPTNAARKVLSLVGCGDLLSSAERVQAGSRSVKVTFVDRPSFLNAVAVLANAISRTRGAGNEPGLRFAVMTPDRFSEQRNKLHKLAMEMKRNNQLTRFSYVIIKGKLAIKASKPGTRDWIIFPPNPQDSPEQEVCPICWEAFSPRKDILAYECGHVFHSTCIREALRSSVKCPACRKIPSLTQLEHLQCLNCVGMVTDMASSGEPYSNEDNTVTTCGHLHLADCQSTFRSGFNDRFPPTADGERMYRESGEPQCVACQQEFPLTGLQINQILHAVQYVGGMSNYIDLSATAPAEPMDTNPATGANAEPLGRNGDSRRDETRSRSRRRVRRRTDQ